MTQSAGGSPDTSIVIVTYNSGVEIAECLEAAILTGAEIVVIDNASRDNTAEVVGSYPVRLIENRENRGFAGAVNQGTRETSASYVLLLNPDAVLLNGIEPLLAQIVRPGVGAVAGMLTGATGQPQAGFTVRRLPSALTLSFEVLGLNRIFPRNPLNWRFRCFGLNLSGSVPIRVEQPAGAFFMFRRECWVALGGFDEQFHPLWFEDVDFCARLKLLGKEILLVPTAVAKHTGAHSILNMTLEIRQLYWYGNLLRYAAKHFSPSGRKLVSLSVLFGVILRSIGQIGRGGAVRKQVVRLAMRCFGGRPGWDEKRDAKRHGGAPAIR